MLKAKILGFGAIVLLFLVSAAFFFIIPKIMAQSTSVIGSEESVLMKSGWKEARPFSVTNFMQRGNDLMLVMKNESEETLILERVCISENECDSRSATVSVGGTIVRLIEVDFECSLGKDFSFETDGIFFEYSQNGKKLVQKAENSIIGLCS